jgi:hypothetical protein
MNSFNRPPRKFEASSARIEYRNDTVAIEEKLPKIPDIKLSTIVWIILFVIFALLAYKPVEGTIKNIYEYNIKTAEYQAKQNELAEWTSSVSLVNDSKNIDELARNERYIKKGQVLVILPEKDVKTKSDTIVDKTDEPKTRWWQELSEAVKK